MLSKSLVLLLAAAACASVPSVYRPCRSLQCVIGSLAGWSRCVPRTRNHVPSEYVIKRFRFHAPYFNATYIDNDLVVRNHDQCYVSEFYYNLATYRAVIGLECPALEFQSTRTVLQHYPLREDQVYQYSYRGLYPTVQFTVIMPLTEQFDLCRANAVAYVSGLPRYSVSPSDRKTSNFLSTDESYLNIFERETFFFRANQLARYYINSALCDFGCDY